MKKTNLNMRYLLIISAFSLTSACAQNDPTPSEGSNIPVLEVSMYHSPSIDHEVAKDHPYDASKDSILRRARVSFISSIPKLHY